MAVKQVNGNPVTATSTVNDGGIIRRGGTIASQRFTATEIGDSTSVHGSQIIEGDDIGKALDGAEFNINLGQGVIRMVTAALADAASDALLGGSDFGVRRSIHKFEKARNSFLSTWSWSSNSEGGVTYSGTVTDTTIGVYGISQEADAPSLGDVAAVPTRLAPGRLVYKESKPIPVADAYPAKTS